MRQAVSKVLLNTSFWTKLNLSLWSTLIYYTLGVGAQNSAAMIMKACSIWALNLDFPCTVHKNIFQVSVRSIWLTQVLILTYALVAINAFWTLSELSMGMFSPEQVTVSTDIKSSRENYCLLVEYVHVPGQLAYDPERCRKCT